MNQKRENMGQGTTLGEDTDFRQGMSNYLILSMLRHYHDCPLRGYCFGAFIYLLTEIVPQSYF